MKRQNDKYHVKALHFFLSKFVMLKVKDKKDALLEDFVCHPTDIVFICMDVLLKKEK